MAKKQAVVKTETKLGRPSGFTPEIGDDICERLMGGESLRSITSEEGQPKMATVMRWLHQFPDFREQYASARAVQTETMLEEIIDIADDNSQDMTTDKDGNEVVNHDVIARARLRVDARKWAMSKLAPKKYGDKLDVNHGGQAENPIAVLMRELDGSSVKVKTIQGERLDDPEDD